MLTAYSIYCDVDVLLNVPFYAGALLADLSLVVNDTNDGLPSWRSGSRTLVLSFLRQHWAIITAIVALFIGSYPPDSPEMAGWSNFMYRIGQMVFPPYCNSL